MIIYIILYNLFAQLYGPHQHYINTYRCFFFLTLHTACIRHSLIMFTIWNLAPLLSLDTPPHTVQHRSLLHSLAYYLAHINLFNYDIIGIPVSYFLYTLSQYCGKSLAAMHHCPANQSL